MSAPAPRQIQRVLQGRRVAVVVLGGDEHDSVDSVHDGAQAAACSVVYWRQGRVPRLVEQRQRELREVDELDVEAA